MSGLRERKKAATRAALSWAAIRLTVERGFEAVKVEDIAEAASVSPRTFNNYFASKAEAIVSRHLDRSRRVARALRARPSQEPLWTAIGAAVQEQFAPEPGVGRSPETSPAGWASGLRAMLAEPALQGELLRAGAVAQADLAAAVAERTGTDLDRDMYPHLVAAAVGAAVSVVTQHFLRAGPGVPVDRLLAEALARIAAGLPTP
ncbi:acyl-CoA-like ligand-binding transcription factor [Rhizomonospora bruguierae]|uniref:acyl-CoA-like ligand-binding transcription factor n=1 Tax=Rhizomonospora bruguierae TaxID=1581705 RepID=UPI001BCB8B97|nr:TetR family transcriptional regulator [Micromonospora sp. NBRC 107566]